MSDFVVGNKYVGKGTVVTWLRWTGRDNRESDHHALRIVPGFLQTYIDLKK